MHEMPVAGHAVDRGVLVHRRHDHSVFYHQIAQAERREHRHRGILEVDVEALLFDFAGIPAVNLAHEGRVPELEVLPGDLLGARHHAEGELRRLHVPIALQVLEPGERHVRGVLGFFHFLAASGVVQLQSGRNRLFLFECLK
jgi:hypothetical protein